MSHNKEWYENYAESKGYKLGDKADKVIEAVNRAEGYCPCKKALWDKTRPNDLEQIACPCWESDNEVAKMGHCTCRLFFKKD
jgi:ferredoxin-thioredoxin reductase catalytic subunit